MIYQLVSFTVRRNLEPRCRARFELTESGGVEFLGADWIDSPSLPIEEREQREIINACAARIVVEQDGRGRGIAVRILAE